jgi:hypothetical protein
MEISYEELEVMLKDRYHFALQETRNIAIHWLEKWCKENNIDSTLPKQKFHIEMRLETNESQAKRD